MEQTGQHIFNVLHHWGYLGIFPMMVIEGPVATIIASMLAALGAFNVFVVLVLSIAGDMTGDIILYWLGRKYGMGFVQHVGKYMGITDKLILRMEKYFKKHGGKTIFAVKSTTGLCWATFAAAGIVKMDFKKFVKYSFLGGVIWSSFLVAMGYFYGYLWREISQYIDWIGWIAVGVAAATFFGVTVYKKLKARKLLKENNNGIKEG